jgi:regulator of sigma E protease
VSWFLAALGFMVLIVFHELGHFSAAKAVGMRVERFSLFFPPLLVRKKIGETEYAIGAIPAGGYVKISGMNPSEELPEEVRDRAYHAQPVWKRIVVIAAGPAVNLVLGFVVLVAYFALVGPHDPDRANEIAAVSKGFPAQGVLHPGDRLVAVNGRPGTPPQLRKIVEADRCPQPKATAGCAGAKPLSVTVLRDGERVTVRMKPKYDAAQDPPRMRLGFSYDPSSGPRETVSFGKALDGSATGFWRITKATVTIPAKILNPEERKQIHGIVGNYEYTRQTIIHDPGDVVLIMAIISLALAIVNLYPFLPLDGGHIFWAVVEKVRRRPVPLATMERSGMVGFALVIVLFVVGLTNDISTLKGNGFGPP